MSSRPQWRDLSNLPLLAPLHPCHTDRSGGISATCHFERHYIHVIPTAVEGSQQPATFRATTSMSSRPQWRYLSNLPLLAPLHPCHPDRSGGISRNRQQIFGFMYFSGCRCHSARRSFGFAQDDKICAIIPDTAYGISTGPSDKGLPSGLVC